VTVVVASGLQCMLFLQTPCGHLRSLRFGPAATALVASLVIGIFLLAIFRPAPPFAACPCAPLDWMGSHQGKSGSGTFVRRGSQLQRCLYELKGEVPT
jgi:hypothetical protein